VIVVLVALDPFYQATVSYPGGPQTANANGRNKTYIVRAEHVDGGTV
jgi:hypothetical protein